VIVVGARVAGSPTAMLLARAGYRVLAVDRARFPSDAFSTHQIHIAGVQRLKRWGLLGKVVESGAPPTRRVRFDPGPAVIEAKFRDYGGADAMYSPRRTVLDAILVDAARKAGAEVREAFVVDEVLKEGGRVVGVRGRERGGSSEALTSRLLVGADGKDSLVAKAVGAPSYLVREPLTMGFYGYFEGLDLKQGHIRQRQRASLGVWPTNGGRSIVYLVRPRAEFGSFREDVEGNFAAGLERMGELGRRVLGHARVGPLRGTDRFPNGFRKPQGRGWALVGDAGLVMDPITGYGISMAFRDAELLAGAVDDAFRGSRTLEGALRGFHRARDHDARPLYKFTARVASLQPPTPLLEAFYRQVARDPQERERFLGMVSGGESMRRYFSPGHLLPLMGWRGAAQAVGGTVRRRGRPPPVLRAPWPSRTAPEWVRGPGPHASDPMALVPSPGEGRLSSFGDAFA